MRSSTWRRRFERSPCSTLEADCKERFFAQVEEIAGPLLCPKLFTRLVVHCPAGKLRRTYLMLCEAGSNVTAQKRALLKALRRAPLSTTPTYLSADRRSRKCEQDVEQVWNRIPKN